MAKSVLVIEADDQGQFYLCLTSGTLALGVGPERVELLLRELHVKRLRCELELDEDVISISRPTPTGQPGTERQLHAGQGVRLSHYRLHVEAHQEDEPQEPAETPDEVPALPPTEGTFRRLRVIDGADLGRAFRLPDAGSLSFGKSARHADVVLHDLYVSRVHCVIEAEDGGKLVVRHQEGDNGTLVNSKRLTGPQELHLGDVVRIGNTHLRLETALTLDAAAETREEDDEEVGVLATKEDNEEEPTDDEVAEPHEFVGRVFGNYRVVELLGKGHTGEVFRARDVRNNLVVALKVLSPSFPADGAELQKFVGVLKVATQLHHPNLVTILAAGRSGPHCWIAREHVEGESAAAVVAKLAGRSKIGWVRAGRAAVHLARALVFLHQQRHVHGNVTPANVLFGEDKVVRLADVMLDKALEGSKLQAAVLEQKLLAELPYLAPEQTDPKAFVDDLADLYSLGAVVYVLLTGRPPFEGASPAEMIEQVRRTSVVRPSVHQKGIPPAIEAVVLKLMAKHQEDRYQTAADLLAAVEAITEAEGLVV